MYIYTYIYISCYYLCLVSPFTSVQPSIRSTPMARSFPAVAFIGLPSGTRFASWNISNSNHHKSSMILWFYGPFVSTAVMDFSRESTFHWSPISSASGCHPTARYHPDRPAASRLRPVRGGPSEIGSIVTGDPQVYGWLGNLHCPRKSNMM